MIEPECELLLQEIERALRVLGIGEQGVARLNFGEPLGLAKAREPKPGELLNLGELFGIERVETMVIVIIFSAGNKLGQGGGAIFGQGKIFDITDVIGPRQRPQEKNQAQTPAELLHGRTSQKARETADRPRVPAQSRYQ